MSPVMMGLQSNPGLNDLDRRRMLEGVQLFTKIKLRSHTESEWKFQLMEWLAMITDERLIVVLDGIKNKSEPISVWKLYGLFWLICQ